MIRPPTHLERLAVLLTSMAATRALCRWLTRPQPLPERWADLAHDTRAAGWRPRGQRDIDHAIAADLERLKQADLRPHYEHLDAIIAEQLAQAERFRRERGAANPEAN